MNEPRAAHVQEGHQEKADQVHQSAGQGTQAAGFTSASRREAKGRNTGHKIVGCVDCRMIVVVDADKKPSFGFVDAEGWHCQGASLWWNGVHPR